MSKGFYKRVEAAERAHWKDVDQYKVYSPAIARGDASFVYLAVDGNGTVALKTYTSQWMFDNEKILANEMAYLSKLGKLGLAPKLLRIPLQTANHIYVAIELCNCKSLDFYIQRKIGIPTEHIKEVTKFLACALFQMKSMGILHREINPRHILVNIEKNGSVSYKLTGLQFCKDLTKEQARSFVGTPEYLSPQAAVEIPYSYESDIWSMGVTLYELAVGETALQVDPNFRVRTRNGKEPVFPYKRPIDPALRDLICKCLVYDPDKRITSEMILEHPFLKGGKVEAPLPDPEPVPKPKKAKQNKDPKLASLSNKQLLKLIKTDFVKFIEYINATENHKVKLKCENRTTLLPYILQSSHAINRGGFGAIYRCSHEKTGEEFALKMVSVSKMTDPKIAALLLGEVTIMLELNLDLENICPFAIRLVDYFVYTNVHDTKNDLPYKNDLCLVIEYCNGGDLDDYIRKLRRKKKDFPLEELKLIAWNSACGINEMHKRNMMHRDIKAKNILVIEDPKTKELIDIKLCDYGLSKKVAEHQELNASTILGTLDYFAPEMYDLMTKRMAGEVINMNYTYKVDIWSYGVLLYFALYGKTIMEYPGSKYAVMNQKKIVYPPVKDVPDSYMDLIYKALTYDPAKRPSFPELLTHPFFTIVIIPPRLKLFPYTQEKLIGAGSSSKTNVYQCSRGSRTFAMKVIDAGSVSKKRLAGEIDTLTKLKNNKNVIKIYDYFAMNNMIYLILDYCNGGDLERYVLKKETHKESISTRDKSFIAYCVLNGLKDLHSRNIIHRDLHPNNIFLTLNYDDSIRNAVIGDFGYARILLDNKAETTIFTAYKSPEMTLPDLGGVHDAKTDIWSFGMVLYFIIFGIHPDSHPGNHKLADLLRKGNVKYDEARAQEYPDLVDLMKKCLKVNPKSRPSAAELLKRQASFS